jgi:Sulfotransferase domain
LSLALAPPFGNKSAIGQSGRQLVFQSEPEFDDAYAAAQTVVASTGPHEFAQGLVAGLIERSGTNCLCAAELLLADATSDGGVSSGMQLLAQAFVSCGHIASVATKVRRTFAQWRDDAYETRRRRDAFRADIVQLGTDASLRRLDGLLDGSADGKIFVIGMNKTGTTSLKIALQQANVLCGPQRQHEVLFPDWAQRRFDRIIDLCRYYEAFQDIPFSLPFTYQALDQAFPDARFILSVRDSPEQWYDSLVRFHVKALFGGRPPSWDLIEAQDYAYPGAFAECSRLFWRWQDFGLYEKERAIDLYRRHNDNILEYFYGRDDKLLVLSLSEPDSYARFARFLGLSFGAGRFGRFNAS